MDNFASSESISKYLEGKDPEKYIVSVEAEYYHNEVSRIINPPNGRKRKIKTFFIYERVCFKFIVRW